MQTLRAGMSEVVITPPVGVRLSGYRDRTSPSTGVLDQLYAKATVLESDGRKLALVVCDLLGLSRPIVQAIRRAVRELAGLEEGEVMVSATHTHCGPDISRLPEASLDHLVAQVAGAVWTASGALVDARIGFATGDCSIGVNRRNPGSPRQPYFLYSYPEGAMDTRVLVLALQSVSGRELGAVVNYPCHAVTLGSKELGISKDYVEHTCSVLKSAWGPGAVPVFLQGCAANVNPRWVYDHPERTPMPPPEWPATLEERLRETRRLGYILGAEALKTASSITRYESRVGLDCRLQEVKLPARSELPEYLRGASSGSPRGSRSKYPDLARRLQDDPAAIATELQVFRIGDAYVIGLPGEVFVEYQMELRSSIQAPVLVSELAGDSIGYVPTPAAMEEGGYEPTVCSVGSEAGGILVRAALEAIRSMRKGP